MSKSRLFLAGLLTCAVLSGLGVTPARAALNGFGDQVASIDYFAAGAASGFDDPKDAVAVADNGASGAAALSTIAPAAGGASSVSNQSEVPAIAAGSSKPAGR